MLVIDSVGPPEALPESQLSLEHGDRTRREGNASVVARLGDLLIHTRDPRLRDADRPVRGVVVLNDERDLLVFESVVSVSTPFTAAPFLPLGSADSSGPAAAHRDIEEALAALPRPRKHYAWYYASGVANEVSGPDDEYDAYLGPSLPLLERGATVDEIAPYLATLTSSPA